MSAGTKPALSSFNQNNYKPVSRILYLRMIPEMAIIYLVPSSLAESICQPTGIGRATLRHLLIWHFSTQSLPHINVTITMRRLLPYIFTLTLAGGYFLWHFLYPVFTRPHPLGGALLFTVRTFLPIKNEAITQPSVVGTKLKKNIAIKQAFSARLYTLTFVFY